MSQKPTLVAQHSTAQHSTALAAPSIDAGRPLILVLQLGHPQLLKGAQGRHDGATDEVGKPPLQGTAF